MPQSIRKLQAAKKASARNASHPTREKLLETCHALLRQKSAEEITADEVLAASGVSRGSLYHHFEDFPDLLETALVQVFASTVDASIESILSALTAQSKQDFVRRLSEVTAASQAPERRGIRLQRAKLIAFSQANPRYAARLAVEQQRLTDAIAELIRQAQQRSWIRPDIDPTAGAVLVQAYTLGRLVDDVGLRQMEPEAWRQLIDRLTERLFITE